MSINPLTVAPVLMGLVAAHIGLQGSALWVVLITSVAGYTIVPLAFLLALKNRGRIESIEARDRDRRSGPLWTGIGILAVAGTGVVLVSGLGYSPLLAVSVVLVLNAVFAATINERFKMSLHVSSVAGLFSILCGLTWLSGQSLPGGRILLVLSAMQIPLLMWARKADRAHSGNEVRVGAIFGLLLPPAELLVMNALWPLYG